MGNRANTICPTPTLSSTTRWELPAGCSGQTYHPCPEDPTSRSRHRSEGTLPSEACGPSGEPVPQFWPSQLKHAQNSAQGSRVAAVSQGRPLLCPLPTAEWRGRG